MHEGPGGEAGFQRKNLERRYTRNDDNLLATLFI